MTTHMLTGTAEDSQTRGLTLAERIDLYKRHGHSVLESELHLAEGRRRVDKIKSMAPFVKYPNLWREFLDLNEIDEDECARLLSLPERFLVEHCRDAAGWREQLEQALAGFSWGERTFEWPETMGLQAKWLELSRPVIAWAVNRILEGLSRIERSAGRRLVLESDVPRLFVPLFVGPAYAITNRTLVLELNIARLQGQLEGKTAEERFDFFIKRISKPEHARALFAEYVVLARQLVESADAIAESTLQFLSHLAHDAPSLEETFFEGQPLGTLTGISRGGDSHRRGKSVLIVEFDGERKLVYKPHSLRVDEHFQDLLRWLNERGQEPRFRTLKCLDRGAYGWTEFITSQDCSTNEEICRFYLRQGAILAVLYAMLAIDFHHENLVASGEQSILVDLESLFHPTLRISGENQLGQAARSAMSYSVLRTAFLPTQALLGGETPFDIGGLSDVEGQETPRAAPYVDMSVADEAHISRKKIRLPGSANIPTLKGSKPAPSDYTAEIVKGFRSMYQLILDHRGELLSHDGPVRRFAGDQIRFIFRNTRTYAVLARETFHPDLQRNALDRDAHFLRLCHMLEARPEMKSLIRSELRALWQGDVPLFYARTDSRDLFDHEDRRHPGLLAKECLAEVTEHILRLNPQDLERQIWFIEGAMACQKIRPGHESGGRLGASYVSPETNHLPSREIYLDEARRAADRISSLALRGDTGDGVGATWLGMVLLRENRWQLLPVGVDLYNGLTGITLFLAYLHHATGDTRYRDLARSALHSVREQQRSIEDRLVLTGAFAGWGGLIYTYAHLYALWNDKELLDDAIGCLERIAQRAEEDENYEILYGNSGGILALNALYEVHPAKEVLEAMEKSGQRILAAGKSMVQGRGWVSKVMNCEPMAGFSHGASGIATSLDVLYRKTSRQEYLEAAIHALEYERTLFSVQNGNWLDVRSHRLDRSNDEELPPASYPVAWCNGCPGIGLSRFRMGMLDEIGRSEVDVALTTTRESGFGYTHSLCHGDLGNLELLLEAQRAGWPGVGSREVDAVAAGILEGIRQRGWICGTPRGIETPGLMTGLAGIGYGFLRLYDAVATPSVLLLDPPRGHRSLGRMPSGDGNPTPY